jgi:hypothetical protein
MRFAQLTSAPRYRHLRLGAIIGPDRHCDGPHAEVDSPDMGSQPPKTRPPADTLADPARWFDADRRSTDQYH